MYGTGIQPNDIARPVGDAIMVGQFAFDDVKFLGAYMLMRYRRCAWRHAVYIKANTALGMRVQLQHRCPAFARNRLIKHGIP